ncbi:hypothetical protein [uncultured Jatrophihabitans sp.]|uniref:hypothetical protein n=1 Tax=uncultured Jatrophihabitans sp. TaxID=1610747 RepID=UPI0035CA815F
MDEGLAAAQALLPAVRLSDPEPLAGGERSTVARVRALAADGAESTLIVKAFRSAGESWVRETAALSVLPAELGAPRLVAADGAPPVAVMTDLGAGASLARLLLGADPDAAAVAVRRWAEGVAAVHCATRGLRAEFRAALDERAGDLPVHDTRIGADVEDAVRLLDAACGRLGVAVPSGAFDELRELTHRLGSAGAAAITPADACPDDTASVGERLVLLDYENAQWRHVSWDVAYLRVPWPTCWCSWRLPDSVADAAVDAYRAAAAATFPEVGAESFGRDVEAATVGWSLMSATLMLGTALDGEPAPAGRLVHAPTRRAAITHRLAGASESGELPAAAELARRLGAELRAQWGDVPLDLAPAFR